MPESFSLSGIHPFMPLLWGSRGRGFKSRRSDWSKIMSGKTFGSFKQLLKVFFNGFQEVNLSE
jgi:hypothetical protein